MKKQTIIRRINKKIEYWESEKSKIDSKGGKKRGNISWMIMELKEIKFLLQDLE